MLYSNDNNIRTLIIDHEEHVLFSLKSIFEKAGYNVVMAIGGKEGINIASVFSPQLIILNILMPEMDGIEVCSELRSMDSLNKSAIIFHTERNDDYSQISAFNAGADDYVIKPVKPHVFLSRVRAILKRLCDAADTKTVQLNGIIIDREKYLVFKEGQAIVLPRKEFELLALLLTSPRKVFTREEIYRVVWGNELAAKSRTIDVHVKKLREKIGGRYIKTIKGIGYSMHI